MNWNKPLNWKPPTIPLVFELGTNPKTKLPQAQAVRYIRGGRIMYVISSETPDPIKDESVTPGNAVLCLERETIPLKNPNNQLIVVEVVEIVESGSVDLKEGIKGFWWGAGKSEKGTLIHFSVLNNSELKPKEPGRWRFEIVGVDQPLDGKGTPHFTVKLIEPIEVKVPVAEVAPVPTVEVVANPAPSTPRGQRRKARKNGTDVESAEDAKVA